MSFGLSNLIEDLIKAIQLGLPQSDGSGRNLLETAYIARGSAYGQLGETQTAITDFDSAIQINLDSAWAYYFRSLAHHDLGNITQRDADASKACSLDKQHC